ncbi:MAG: polysaccharide lyase [Cytophagaceae bacterium]
MKLITHYIIIIPFIFSFGFNASKPAPPPFWEAGFEDEWKINWAVTSHAFWGERNMEIIDDDSPLQLGKIARIKYPQGSASPAVSREAGAPLGGANFYATAGMPARDTLFLRYYMRFDKEFEFVKGGKLPGLYGGTENSGGKIPDGTDGFSTRYMWRKDGAGELYAYLPTSDIHGTSIGRGNWTFEPGKWYCMEQCVILNKPGKANGKIKIWVNEKLILSVDNVLFRTTDKLKIEGIFFSTFFGGGDVSFATKQTAYAYFGKFALSTSYIGK